MTNHNNRSDSVCSKRSLSRHRLVVLLLCALVLIWAVIGSTGCRRSPTKVSRWNVVIVLVDTLRADHLPIYGYDRPTSPFLQEFSRRGVIFSQARSQAACTFPSVNSLLTSRYPQHFQNSVREYGWGIPKYLPTLAEMLQAVGYVTAAVSSSGIVRVNPSPRNPDGGYGAGFAEFDDKCMRQSAACVNKAAYRILDTLAEPFFLYLHYFDPHIPYQPPADHTRLFAANNVQKEWVAEGTLGPISSMLYDNGPAVEFTDQDLAHTIDLYDEEILYFDRQFSELIRRLEADGLLDHTLLVFASDHGEEFLEHRHVYHCRDLIYDTTVKTPFIFWIPGLRSSGAVNHTLAQNLDIVPTILDYLKIDWSTFGLDGTSLRPALEENRSVHQYIFGVQRYERWVASDRYKLSYNIKSGDTELFDLRLDPGERTNLTARRPHLTEELQGVLMHWMDKIEGDVDLAARVEKATEVTERLRALGYL